MKSVSVCSHVLKLVSKLFVLFLLFSFAVLASVEHHEDHRGGNGGKVILCDVDGKETIELLDYHRATVEWDMTLKLSQETSAMKKAQEILSRLLPYDPNLYSDLMDKLASFESESKFFRDYKLFFVDDSDEVGIPQNCKLELAINQKVPRFPEDRRYRINQRLWDKMNEDQKAGIILHEIILNQALSWEHDTSEEASYFTALLSSTKLSSLIGITPYLAKLQTLGFYFIDHGLRFYPNNLWIKNNRVAAGFVKGDRYLNKNGKEVVGVIYRLNDKVGFIDPSAAVSFYSTGQLECARFMPPGCLKHVKDPAQIYACPDMPEGEYCFNLTRE